MLGFFLGTKPYKPQVGNSSVEVNPHEESRSILRTSQRELVDFGINPYFTNIKDATNYRDSLVTTLQNEVCSDYKDRADSIIDSLNALSMDKYVVTGKILEVTYNSKMRKKSAKKVAKFLKQKSIKPSQLRAMIREVDDFITEVMEAETGVHSSDWAKHESVGEFFTEGYEAGLRVDTGYDELGDLQQYIVNVIHEAETVEDEHDVVKKVETPTPKETKVKTHWRLW